MSSPTPPSQAPNGRVLPFGLYGLDEPALFRPGNKAALYALGANQSDYHPERDPLICVHGIEGAPVDLQAVVDRFRSSRFQLYVLAYADWHRRTSFNGNDLADELSALTVRIGTGRTVNIAAHSMGGIVCRQALNQLAAGPRAARFGALRLFAADTPWHGYPGPSDRGIDATFMQLARVFLPAGLDDMRAESAMFQGDPGSDDPATRAGLFGVELPDHFSIDVSSAVDGDEVFDYTEDVLTQLPPKLVAYFTDETPVRGDARILNYWHALIAADAYWDFQELMRELADHRQLDLHAALAALGQHYPRFPGDHVGVVREHAGQFSFIDHLAAKLG